MTKKMKAGIDSISQLPSILNEWKSSRVFLVTGKKSFNNFIKSKNILSYLDSFEVFRYADFSVNPKVEDIKKGIQIAKQFSPDVVIGIGGGSVMDTAKLIATWLNTSDDIIEVISNNEPPPDRRIKLLLIPTTAGSGSEATHFSVVYLGNKKYSVASSSMLPDAVILDSEFTDNIPKYLTAVTALDALSQAIESFWAVGATEKSREYALESIIIINSIFNTLIVNPTKNVRKKMLYAAHLAGQAINISKTTAPHAISYSITTKYGIPHGHAVALTLGLFFEYNSASNGNIFNNTEKIEDYDLRYNQLLKAFNVQNAIEAKSKIRKMMRLAGMSTRLSQIGMEKEDEINYICDSINMERLNNNPFKLTKSDLFNMLIDIF